MFADKGHAYAARVLEKDGVELLLGTGREGDRPRPRHAVGRVDDQDPLRHLGRRPDGRADRRRRRAAAGSRRPDRRPAGLHGRRLPRRARHRRHREHPGPSTARPIRSSARSRCRAASSAAKTILADSGRQEAKPFSVPRQGDDGDDRPGGRRRAGQGRRAPRQVGVRGLAGRPRRADDRRQQPGRCLQELGAATTSARTGRPRRSTGAGRRRMAGKRTTSTSRRSRPSDAPTAERGSLKGETCPATGDSTSSSSAAARAAGTLARHLAPSGKRILILERGGWLPRENENWDSEGGLRRQPIRPHGDLVRRQGQGVPARDPLLRSAARRSSTARPSTGCGPRTSASCAITTGSRPRGRSRTTRWSPTTRRPSSCTRSTATTARTRPRATPARSIRSRP